MREQLMTSQSICGNMDWEDTKENFVPVKQGRSATALSTPLSTTKRSNGLDDARRCFLDDIRTSDDPLAAWLKYIKWTQEQFTTQGSKSELQHVLEAATKALSTTEQYNNDVRLLRIWVQYADCLPDPSDVFLFLESRSIGRDHALLYEAYATYLELKGNYQQADLVFQEGINRLAKPVERLKQKYIAFQQRMAKRIQRQNSEVLLGMDLASGPAALAPARATLAPLDPTLPPDLDENGQAVQGGRQRQRQQRMQQQQQQPASVAAGFRAAPQGSSAGSSSGSSSRRQGGLWAAPPPAAAAAPSGAATTLPVGQGNATGSNSSSTLAVLVDEEFGPAGTGPVPSAFPAAAEQHSQLPGFTASRKENTKEAAAWAGTKLKQRAMFTGPVAGKLEVLDDEESEEQEGFQQQQQQQQHKQNTADSKHSATAALLGQHLLPQPKQLPVPATLLPVQQQQQPRQQQQPAQQPQLQHVAHSSSSNSSRLHSQTAAKTCETGAGHHRAPAVVSVGAQGYLDSLLIGKDGAEMSFEEARAALWRDKAKRRRQVQQHTEHQTQQQRQQAQQHTQHQAQQHKPHAQQQDAGANRRQIQAVRQEHVSASQSDVQDQRRRGLLENQQGTAHKAVEPHAQYRQQQQRQQDVTRLDQWASLPAAVADPTVTVNTRAAFESMNSMFSSDTVTLPRDAISAAAAGASGACYNAAAASSWQCSASAAAAAEPTVTVNTRAAFEAMNGMFATSFCDDTTTMHHFGAAAAHSGAATAAATCGGRASGLADPTVTINTRAAIDAMNDMFNDMTAHTQTMTGRQLLASRRGRPAAAGRPPMAPVAAADEVGRVAVYEDTELIAGNNSMTAQLERGRGISSQGRAGHGSEAAISSGNSGFGVYEDTEFVGSRMAEAAAAETSGAGGSRRLSLAATRDGALGANDVGGLGLYEDTEFMTSSRVATAAAAGGGGTGHAVSGHDSFNMYEDTEFITRPVAASKGTLLQGSSAAAATSMMQSSTGCIGMYEDTEFITRPVAAAAAGIDRLSLANEGLGGSSVTAAQPHHLQLCIGSSGNTENIAPAAAAGSGAAVGIGLYEDTEFLTRPVGHAAAGSHGLEIHADTELLAQDTAAASRSATAGNHCPAGRGVQLQRQQQEWQQCLGPKDCSDIPAGVLLGNENLPAITAAAAAGRDSRGPELLRPQRSLATEPGPQGSCNVRPGHSSALSSPEGHAAASRGTTTPSRPPSGSAAGTPAGRVPQTPSTPWAKAMEDFEVMDSPAVRAALAGRPPMVMSPAATQPSPRVGAQENRNPDLGSKADRAQLASRADHSRVGRPAAALQPISTVRAQQLGLRVEPAGAPGAGDDADVPHQHGSGSTSHMAGQSSSPTSGSNSSRQYSTLRPCQGRALRSLKFSSAGDQAH